MPPVIPANTPTGPALTARKRDAGAAAAPCQTMGINEFTELSGLSRMTIWRLCRSGQLESFKIGVKRLIVLSSWNELVRRRTMAEKAR